MFFEKKLVYTDPDSIITDSICRSDDDALYGSIKKNGILTPLTVFRDTDGEYRLCDGARRLSAARKTGLKKIPCFVLDADPETAALYTLILKLTNLPSAQISANELEELKTRFSLDDGDISLKTGLPVEIFSPPAKEKAETAVPEIQKETKKRPPQKIYTGNNVKFFVNSILRITDMMREKGIPAKVRQSENENAVELCLTLPKADQSL